MTAAEIERLVIENQNLIPFLIKKRFGSFPLAGRTEAECWQLGLIGLFMAAQRWDKTTAFGTCAQWWIFSTVVTDIHEQSNGFHIGARMQNNACTLKKYCARHELSLAALTPDNEALFVEVKIRPKRLPNVITAIQLSGSLISLDQPLTNSPSEIEKHRKLSEIVPNAANIWQDEDKTTDDPSELYEQAENLDILQRVLESDAVGLSRRQKQLLRLYLTDVGSMTDAGRLLGMSRALTHYTKKAAMKKIQRYFQDQK